ncbi:MAG: DNA repair exonuclease [Acidobacteria bacterium]|nr:DNA repair exonuclease [Acidobacteriota bacterium]
MARFLHLADIHLGIRRYRSEDRTRDFFLAWQDVIERYAIGEKVDFVLVAGDFFDARKVEPQAMNHAIAGLERLRNAGIPVVAIEGNHDCREAESSFSWMRSLSQWRFLHLLEPVYDATGVSLLPWNDGDRRGSYIDIAGVRIFGSLWYGSTVSQALGPLIETLRRHVDERLYSVLMLHTDVEGQLNRPIPALPVARLAELRSSIRYLALGHTHRNFEIDGWVYNPGSLEACNVDEYFNERGAYLVETGGDGHRAELKRTYRQRPIIRHSYDVTGDETPEDLFSGLVSSLRSSMAAPGPAASDEALAPVTEVTLRGQLPFSASRLELNRYREEIQRTFNPLLVILRNLTLPIELVVGLGLSDQTTRAERERRVIEDLLSREARYRDRASAMAGLILETKRLALASETPERLLELIDRLEEWPE